ncbi:MAG: hypothetical protein ACK5KV_02995 [Bacteroides graminisolvens]|uniref:hypothetical protein n=1 Tax=Bacteroides graminisolvens TaxID=477666 RepID=UPI003A8536E8
MFNVDSNFIERYAVPYVAKIMSAEPHKIAVDYVVYYLSDANTDMDIITYEGGRNFPLGIKLTEIIPQAYNVCQKSTELGVINMALDLYSQADNFADAMIFLDNVKYEPHTLNCRFFNELFYNSNQYGAAFLHCLRFRKID